MKIGYLIQRSWQSLRHHTLRTLLTMIGIIVGIGKGVKNFGFRLK